MKNLFPCLALVLMFISFQSCTDSVNSEFKDYTEEEYELLSANLDLPQGVFDYSTEFETGFFSPTVNERDIHTRRSNHKATLGRVLFYDNLLSKNETVSCASCHKQEIAFADDVALSEGFEGELTIRNSLPLGNTIGFETSYGGGSFSSQRAFFGWDEGNIDINDQSIAAITSEIEMGLHLNEALEKVKAQDYYRVLFKKAYGDDDIRTFRMLEAITEFVNSISSKDSKFDQALMKEHGNPFNDFSMFTAQENLGKNLYLNNCANCHSTDHQFTAVAKANNGLDLEYEDKGVGERTGLASDAGVFKVPFLRNIELTGPYMHDGRFETLEEVVEHYSTGIQSHPNLSNHLGFNGVANKMNFSSTQKSALVAYLKTLTDEEVIADVRFSDPFK